MPLVFGPGRRLYPNEAEPENLRLSPSLKAARPGPEKMWTVSVRSRSASDGVRPATSLPLRRRFILLALFLLLLATPVLSMAFGAASVAPADVWTVVRSHLPGATGEVDGILNAIIWQNRLPRVLTGMGVGAILGVSGVVLQAIVRNPLAEPYVLGISAGASTGAAFAMVVIGVTSGMAVAGFAFVAAALATAAVLIAGGRGHHTALQLILAGLAVGFIFQAITNLLVFSSDSPETSRAVVFWTLGSLSRATWPQVGGVLGTATVLAIGFWIAAPILDALASGDRAAMAVGVDPARVRLLLTLVVSAGVAFAVATSGSIGFVGLVVPHLVRSWVGHSHRAVVLGSAFASAVFLVGADTFARSVFAPAEVPIGVITGLLGAPLLLGMLRAQGAKG